MSWFTDLSGPKIPRHENRYWEYWIIYPIIWQRREVVEITYEYPGIAIDSYPALLGSILNFSAPGQVDECYWQDGEGGGGSIFVTEGTYGTYGTYANS